jgi:hypothetical protein
MPLSSKIVSKQNISGAELSVAAIAALHFSSSRYSDHKLATRCIVKVHLIGSIGLAHAYAVGGEILCSLSKAHHFREGDLNVLKMGFSIITCIDSGDPHSRLLPRNLCWLNSGMLAGVS